MDIITTRSPAFRFIGLFFFILVCLFCSSVSAADVSACMYPPVSAEYPPVFAEYDIFGIDVVNSIPYITTHTTDDTLYGGVLLSMHAMTDEQKTNAALYGVTEDDVMGIVRDALLFNTVDGENSLHEQIEKIVANIVAKYHVDDRADNPLRKYITNRVIQSENFAQYFERYADKVIPQVGRVHKDILRLKIANDAAYYLNTYENSYKQTNQKCCCETPKPPQQPYTEVEYYAAKSGWDTGYDFGCFMGSDLNRMTYLPQPDDFKYIPFKNTPEHPYTTDWFEQCFKDGCEQGKDDISKKDIREQLRITNQKLNEIHETTKEIKNIAAEIANNTKPKLDAVDLTFKSLGTFGTILNTGLNIARFIIKPI